MSDPEETPAQAIERLRKEIAQLRRLRAQMPMLILEPYVEEASAHITEVAAKLTVIPTIPASEAIAESRVETQATSQPPTAQPSLPILPIVGSIMSMIFSPAARVIVLYNVPSGPPEKPEWETVVLTEDGRILTVKPEELTPETAGPAEAAAAPALSSGARVRIKPSGKTGYVSEVADANAIVALDEGGFLTVPIADLEPV